MNRVMQKIRRRTDCRNPHTDGDPFHHAGKRGFIQLCLLCICQRVYSILCNQINGLRFAIIGKLQCAEGLPFFDCALYTFGNIRLTVTAEASVPFGRV